MKKLLFIATALIVLMGAVTETFAADIVVRQVKIKKKNVRTIANPPGDGRTYHMWIDCNDFELTQAPGGKDDQTVFAFSTTFSKEKGATMSTATMEITVMDCNMKSTTKTLTLTAGKDGNYTGSISLPSVKGCTLTLVAADIYATNTDGEVAVFESELDKDCKAKTDLNNMDYTTDNSGGVYVMNFSMAFEQELPAGASMLVQVTDCRGNHATVTVKLAYDAATGKAVGSAGITQVKDCMWTLTYGEVYAIDPCGDERTWAVDFGQEKTNGTGTRDGANSVKASKPKLK